MSGCPPSARRAIRRKRPQRAQIPPATERVSGSPGRRRSAQTGSGSDGAPRAASSVTSAPTTGGAPTVNAPGSAISAAARLRSAAGWPATTIIAAWTWDDDSSGAAASTATTTCRCRCSRLSGNSLTDSSLAR